MPSLYSRHRLIEGRKELVVVGKAQERQGAPQMSLSLSHSAGSLTRPLTCTVCSKVFSSYKSLVAHSRAHGQWVRGYLHSPHHRHHARRRQRRGEEGSNVNVCNNNNDVDFKSQLTRPLHWLLDPTRSRGMMRSSEPCLRNTLPAVWAGLMPMPSLVMIADVSGETLNCTNKHD